MVVHVVGATLCWGVADVLCDICIGEEEEDDEDEEMGLEAAPLKHQSGLPRNRSRSASTSSSSSSGSVLSGWRARLCSCRLVTFAVMHAIAEAYNTGWHFPRVVFAADNAKRKLWRSRVVPVGKCRVVGHPPWGVLLFTLPNVAVGVRYNSLDAHHASSPSLIDVGASRKRRASNCDGRDVYTPLRFSVLRSHRRGLLPSYRGKRHQVMLTKAFWKKPFVKYTVLSR